MLHELTHMEIGPHNASFYKMLDELRDECEKLMREGTGCVVRALLLLFDVISN